MSEQIPAKPNGNGHHHAMVELAPDDFILRLVRDEKVTPEKLQAVVDSYIKMQETQRMWSDQDRAEAARLAFYQARSKMQAKLPVLEKDTPNQEGKGKYLDFGDLWEACFHIWTEAGFTVSYDVEPSDDGLIHVVLLLDHDQGHRETYRAPPTPPDTTGPRGTVNKTIPQGSQSTITYLQRGLLTRAIGIAMKREDDDGNSGATDDNPHRPHKKPTPGRERDVPTDRPSIDWVDRSYATLDAAPSPDAWMTTLGSLLTDAPSAMEATQLQARIKPYLEREKPPRKVLNQIEKLFADRMAQFAGPKPDPKSEPEHPVLPPDEQWAEDQISELAGVWDINTFTIMAQNSDTQAKMKGFSTTNRPLYERVKAAYETTHTRIIKAAAR